MQSINLYDVATQAISRRYKKADPKRIKAGLVALDPLSPKRAFSKLSYILAICDTKLRTKLVS